MHRPYLSPNGEVEKEELLRLGQERRRLGQKKGVWSEEQNAALMNAMDTDGNGHISQVEFVTHFSSALPEDPKQFNTVIREFVQVAEAGST